LTENFSDKCIVLVGLPGVGKTTIGSALAQRLGFEFFDSDREIERLSGMTVAEFFESHGEQAFRELERKVVAQLISGNGRVVALGGGAFVNPATRDLVKQQATSIWLDASLDAIRSRLKGGPERPLLQRSDSALEELASERSASYAEADIRIVAGPVEETLEAVERALREPGG
jgi:shikimate kinase